MSFDATFLVGMLLVVVGIVLIIISSIKMARGGGGSCESSGLILIGPIPIVWGSSRRAVALMGFLTAIIIFIVAMLWVASLTGG